MELYGQAVEKKNKDQLKQIYIMIIHMINNFVAPIYSTQYNLNRLYIYCHIC